MKEGKKLEFKENVSDSFLKTVSAFANYDGGTILFGVRDDGEHIGMHDADEAALAIENKINDSIRPLPSFEISVESDSVIALKIHPGSSKPYYYRSKSYRRSGTSTVEADPSELSELILEGRGVFFDQLPAKRQSLEFDCLARAFESKVGLSRFDSDTLKTLGLLSLSGTFNNAGELLADENGFPGMDMARFGETISVILNRETYTGRSVLEQYQRALHMFKEFFEFEEIDGFDRVRRELIPEAAFREAIANALVHRNWSTPANIRVSLFADRVEIASPGGLPKGLTEKEYLQDELSVPRNPVLANVFLRLELIEAFGTGVRRIMEAYEGSASKPLFRISENVIVVVLPLKSETLGLSTTEQAVYNALSSYVERPLSWVVERTGFSKSKANALMKRLMEMGVAEAVGTGRSVKYKKR